MTSPELQHAVEQFYYREARLLDGRHFQQWLGLLSEDILYRMPSRINVQVDNRQRGTEDMLSIERELEQVDGDGCPLREENLIHLSVRVERSYKINSWAENPPPRTRRIIGNVEIEENTEKSLAVLSNFHLHYSRPGSPNFIYSGQRRDELQLNDGNDQTFKLLKRDVIMDYSTIDVPTLGLIL